MPQEVQGAKSFAANHLNFQNAQSCFLIGAELRIAGGAAAEFERFEKGNGKDAARRDL